MNLILQFNSSQLKMEQFATEFEFELRCRINHMSLNVIGCHMNMSLKLTCPLPSTKLHAHFSIHCNLLNKSRPTRPSQNLAMLGFLIKPASFHLRNIKRQQVIE